MSDTQLIKEKIDVVDLINEYVQMKPAGINHKGLCPFHQEKTPSFMANRERQNWHCFGCGKGGDVFTFVQEIEGMEFVEALKYLANRAGVQLTNTFQNEVQSSQKNRIKEINAEAAHFFHNFLIKMDASKSARDYLTTRGFSEESIEEWGVGFVPDQWDLLTKYLLKKGHSIDDLVASGLTIKRDGSNMSSGRGFYDRFRGRIMFPIHNVHGNVVGFTGRVLVETEKSGGKYVNTPQTLVYDKSRVVFGLNKAKREIKSKNLIVMTEGQLDVIAAHQAGMKNVVASSGTALTEEQVKLLKRYSSNMSMAFDADDAGQKAARRGIAVALGEGMGVKVIHIPEGAGEDPDECIKQNKDVWFRSVGEAEGVMSWYFRKAFDKKDINDPKQKQQIVEELLPEIGLIPFAVERDHWLQELSTRLAVDVAVLREDLVRVKKQEKRVNSNQKIMNKKEKKTTETSSRLDLLLERLFVLFLRFPGLITDYWPLINEVDLSTHRYFGLYKAMEARYTKGVLIDIDLLKKDVENEREENIVDVLLMRGELDFSALQEKESKGEVERLIQHIKDEYAKTRRRDLGVEIERAEKAGDKETLQRLLEEFRNIQG